MKLRQLTSAHDRRRAVTEAMGVAMPHTGTFSLDESVAGTRNCEQMIGVTQVPLGVAGPLRLRSVSTGTVGEYYVPLATTEGALVASVNRGSRAITESGGADVHTHTAGATRGPVFAVNNLAENTKLYEFLESHRDDFARIAEGTSKHLKLRSVASKGVGKYRFVRFAYDTQDAMGLNMVTIATGAVATFIEKQTGARLVSLSGNFCVDKKPSWQNAVRGRGHKVWAEVVLPEAVLTRVLKTDARSVYNVWLAKCMLGSAVSGSMGFNAQYANIVAALFIATGQDPAHVVEGSIGITTAEVVGAGDLYISVHLPDLMVGTVGGGTGLATQAEALSLLGVLGGNNGKNALRLAEIVGGAVLAGEISLLSSLGEGSLVRAHEKLGRGK